METKNWEKRWMDFVVKEMCPERCGHLRFKIRDFIKEEKKKSFEEGCENGKNVYKKAAELRYQQGLKDARCHYYEKVSREAREELKKDAMEKIEKLSYDYTVEDFKSLIQNLLR